MRTFAAVALLAMLAPAAVAQRGGFGAPHFSPGVPMAPGFEGLTPSQFTGFHRGFASPFYNPLTWASFSDYFPVESPAPPPVIVMQAPPAQAAAAVPLAPPLAITSEPLMIELRGDRYVRVPVDQTTGTTVDIGATAPAPKTAAKTYVASAPRSVILVFRDGHREEVSDYTITGGALYARANYYDSGHWNRKIELSELNLPATENLNQAMGIPFTLPSSPNEVIVGP